MTIHPHFLASQALAVAVAPPRVKALNVSKELTVPTTSWSVARYSRSLGGSRTFAGPQPVLGWADWGSVGNTRHLSLVAFLIDDLGVLRDARIMHVVATMCATMWGQRGGCGVRPAVVLTYDELIYGALTRRGRAGLESLGCSLAESCSAGKNRMRACHMSCTNAHCRIWPWAHRPKPAVSGAKEHERGHWECAWRCALSVLY